MYEEYFNNLPQQEMKNFFINEIAPMGHIKSYNKGQRIHYLDSSKAYQLAIVIDGKLKICTYTKDGIEKILFMLSPEEIFLEETLFDSRIPVTPVPMEKSTIAFIPGNIIRNYINEFPQIYTFLFHSVLRKYKISIFQINDLLKRSPKSQVCSTIYRLIIQNDSEYSPILNITHENLANIIGCSRVTVTRVLKELKDEGIIDTSKQKITVINFKKIKKYSDL